MLYAMLRHLIARRLADPPRPVVDSMTRKTYSLILCFGLSIPVFFATTDGWLLWIAGPVLVGLFRQRQRRNHRRPEGSQRRQDRPRPSRQKHKPTRAKVR